MLKKHSFWLKSAIFLQFTTGLFHVLSFFNSPKPANDSEKQLLDLMSNYKFDLGAGYHRSMDDIMTAFSVAFALLFFFSGVLNTFLRRSNLPANTMKGVILINIFAYLICFLTMSMLTFLPPIICTGLILLTLLIAYFKQRKLSQ
jgi:uncharacterized membrane protein HdeD (DUF308 family)